MVKCSSNVLGVSWYFKDQVNHGSPPLPVGEEAIQEAAAIGEKELRDEFAQLDFQHIVDSLRNLQNWIRDEVVPVHGDHLPNAHRVK